MIIYEGKCRIFLKGDKDKNIYLSFIKDNTDYTFYLQILNFGICLRDKWIKICKINHFIPISDSKYSKSILELNNIQYELNDWFNIIYSPISLKFDNIKNINIYQLRKECSLNTIQIEFDQKFILNKIKTLLLLS